MATKKVKSVSMGGVATVWLIVRKKDGMVDKGFDRYLGNTRKEALEMCRNWYGEDFTVVKAEVTWTYSRR